MGGLNSETIVLYSLVRISSTMDGTQTLKKKIRYHSLQLLYSSNSTVVQRRLQLLVQFYSVKSYLKTNKDFLSYNLKLVAGSKLRKLENQKDYF